MDELNVESIDGRDELGQGVELRFCLAPVVSAPPIGGQRLDLGQLSALRAVCDGLSLRPARLLHPSLEVNEVCLRNADPERADRRLR